MTQTIRRAPERTCVGCRQRDEQTGLLRVVAVEESLVDTVSLLQPDPTRRLPGRGAYVHPAPSCVEQAIQRRAFGRALRTKVHLEVETLRQWIAQKSSTRPSD